MSSPWAKIPTSDPINLQDIISEEVIKKVRTTKNVKDINLNAVRHQSENDKVGQKSVAEISDESDLDQESDAIIARLLQKQFIEEYNNAMKNASNKVLNIPVCFKNSHRPLQNFDDESDSEEEENIEEFHDHKDWEQSETVKREITKHDITLSEPCMSKSYFGFHGNDETDFDINFKVLKRLKSYQKRGKALIDEHSILQICEMIKQQMFKSVNYIISRGRETVILHAESDPVYSNALIPKECALKVFKLDGCKKTNILAEKEMLNLQKLQKAGILCPKVVTLKKNILIMSFIGENGVCATRLKDAVLTDNEYVLAYNQVVEALKNLYKKANLIYLDLSEDKIFWHNQQCYFIGLSEAIEVDRYETFHFFRNCRKIIDFFGWKGVPNVVTARELFTQITQIKDN